MSAWVIALGLGAGYLINKNLSMRSRLAESVETFQRQADPANPGPETEEIRQVQATVPDADRYQDMNLQDLSRKDVQGLVKAREQAFREVAAYEQGAPPIQGVYLSYDRHGV
jgi:hypothetical protein